MVFENITLIELHLEGSSFGPSFGDAGSGEASSASAATSGSEGSSGSRLARPLGGLVLLAIAGGVAYWQYRSRGSSEDDIEEDTDPITIEHAAE